MTKGVANNIGQSHENGGTKCLIFPTYDRALVNVGWDEHICQVYKFYISQSNETLTHRENYKNVVDRNNDNGAKMRQMPVIHLFGPKFVQFLEDVINGTKYLTF